MNARLRTESAFVAGADVRAVFDACGGCVSGDQLAARMAGVCDQPISRVARLLVERRVVRLDCGGRMRLPLFQFDACLAVRPVVRCVLLELAPVLDDAEIAEWFATPNGWIGDQVPASLVEGGADRILDAARAYRFVLRGG